VLVALGLATCLAAYVTWTRTRRRALWFLVPVALYFLARTALDIRPDQPPELAFTAGLASSGHTLVGLLARSVAPLLWYPLLHDARSDPSAESTFRSRADLVAGPGFP
jgi:hypothetical protein